MIVILTTGERYEIWGDVEMLSHAALTRFTFFDVSGKRHSVPARDIVRIVKR